MLTRQLLSTFSFLAGHTSCGIIGIKSNNTSTCNPTCNEQGLVYLHRAFSNLMFQLQ